MAAVARQLRDVGCVFAEEEAQLLLAVATTSADLAAMVTERTTGTPLEHVVGWAEFCGLRVVLAPGVFVPRRRTELLAAQAAALARRGAVVVDLCTGSGAVGAALMAAVEDIELHAVDIDPAAVQCARCNLEPAARVYEGDLYEPLPGRLRGRVGVLVVNAPHVPSAAIALMPAEARTYEPGVALDGGVDGLDVLRRVISSAPSWLAPDGHVVVEAGEQQVGQLCAAMERSGLVARIAHSGALDATVVIGGPAEQADVDERAVLGQRGR